MRQVLYIYVFALLTCFILSLIGCSKKVYVPVEKVTTITETIRDTVIEIQLEQLKDSVVTPDTINHLQNKYADSWAMFSGGRLHHSLNSRAARLPVHIQVVDRVKNILEPKITTVDKIIYKDKELTWWQRIRIFVGDLALIGLFICLIIKTKR